MDGGMAIMSNLTLSLEKLFEDNTAKCPKCKSGYLNQYILNKKKRMISNAIGVGIVFILNLL